MTDEIKNKVEGNVKEAAGEVTGDRELEARGAGQKAVGEVEEAGRKATGAAEEVAGKVTGNPAQEAEGRIRQS